MSTDVKQAGRLLTILTPAGPDVLVIGGFTASEGISRLFHVDVELMASPSQASKVDPDKIVGQPVAVKVALGDDYRAGTFRCFHGIVSRFSLDARDERFVHYHAEIVPWTWLLTRSSHCRIFQDLKVPEIISSIFNELKGKYSFVNYENKTDSGNYAKLDYCVQYRETDFNFVSRLMEQEGIHFFFRHEEHKHTLVLVDSPQGNPECPHQSDAHYLPEGGVDERGRDTIRTWRMQKQMRTGQCTLRDYHFQMPQKSLEVSRPTSFAIGGNGELETYDYQGGYAHRFNKPDQRLGEVEDEGRKLVKLRMEEEETRHLEIHGTSDCRTLASGHTFTLTDHFEASQNSKYLVTDAQHTAMQSPDYYSGEPRGEAYINTFQCIPADVPFRPARTTPKPVIGGVLPAVVTGPPGEEIWPDKYGRVKVQFFWDREGKRDENSSCWVRVSQAYAGQNWGFVCIPRIGQEVLVGFLDGDPDRPVITGRVYNAAQMPPYALPASKTQSGLKSRSSKGGSPDNFNEIRFEDKKGQEQVYLHAEKNQDIVVENDETHSVGHDRTKTVGHDETSHIKHDRTETVDNNEKITVVANRTEKVGKDETITIDGNRSETVAKNEKITVNGSRSEDVSKDESITINGSRQESVGKSEQLQVSDDRTHSVGENDTLSVGKLLAITAGDSITITTGKASITLRKDGTILINGKDIAITGSGQITGKASKDMVLKGKKILQN